MLLHQTLDGGELVLRIQNLKRLRQARQLPVRPQQTITQTVESAYPHAAHLRLQHVGQARAHLFGGFVGKSHGQNIRWPALARLQQPRNARGQHTGLA